MRVSTKSESECLTPPAGLNCCWRKARAADPERRTSSPTTSTKRPFLTKNISLSLLTRSLPRAILTFHHPGGQHFWQCYSDSEGRDGSFIVRRSAVPPDQKVTNSRHMMAPKLRFSRGLKAKAPGAVTACVPGPLRRRSSKFLQARRPRPAQEATMGKVTIFFFYLRGSFKCMIVTNVLTQRSCLGFLLTADSQCFTRNDARIFVPTIPRRRLWQDERSL